MVLALLRPCAIPRRSDGATRLSTSLPVAWLVWYFNVMRRGATCYMNSLLQCLYMTPELREVIYALQTDKLGVKKVCRL
jgi:hypothetical protein